MGRSLSREVQNAFRETDEWIAQEKREAILLVVISLKLTVRKIMLPLPFVKWLSGVAVDYSAFCIYFPITRKPYYCSPPRTEHVWRIATHLLATRTFSRCFLLPEIAHLNLEEETNDQLLPPLNKLFINTFRPTQFQSSFSQKGEFWESGPSTKTLVMASG